MSDQTDDRTNPCDRCETGEYTSVYETMDYERYRCDSCGDSYTLYDDEMR